MKAKQTNDIIVLLLLAIAITATALDSKPLIVDNLGDNAFSGLLICTLLADVAVVVSIGIMIAKSRKQQDKE